VTGFSDDWLALREPYDAASRSAEVGAAAARWRPPGRRLRVIDLGCGTGANIRWLAPRLGGDQDWEAVDRDAALLDRLGDRMAAWARQGGFAVQTTGDGLTITADWGTLRLRARQADLARPPDLEEFDLVTASALLDLVSADWIDRVAAGADRQAFCFALSYSGGIAWAPKEPLDGEVERLVDRHQRTDKGFGPALGPAAARVMTQRLREHGAVIVEGRSEWRFGPADRAIQAALLDDLAAAASAIDPAAAGAVGGWRTRRHVLIAAGRSALTISHTDLFAAPAAQRRAAARSRSNSTSSPIG
jgi:SAM-dependent methyltransferase